MTSKDDILLYKELLSVCGDIVAFTQNSKTFHSQFRFAPLNEQCYDKIYGTLKKVIPRMNLFPIIPDLEVECKECWKFYLSPRNRSIRGLDIQLGKKFEHKLIEFLNKKHIDCRKGDIADKKFPDNVVYKDGSIKAYLEIKYQSAPWIYAYKDGGSNRECYEGSPALDVKKLKQQIELIESGVIKAPVFYVYWLDFPCIKGVFYVSAMAMNNYFKNDAFLFNRKEREGDFITKNGKKVKVAATLKIHPSLFMMGSFNDLINTLS